MTPQADGIASALNATPALLPFGAGTELAEDLAACGGLDSAPDGAFHRVPQGWARREGAPRLTEARCELLREIQIADETGNRRTIHIPAERPLTVFVDKRELVTLMTLGAMPELLVLGYLCNQRLIKTAAEVESITVDWEVGAAAVKTHVGLNDLEEKTAHRVVTTGCGQGTVFGDLMTQVDSLSLPSARIARIRQSLLYRMLETMRGQHSIHRKAGSVHGCALFQGEVPVDAPAANGLVQGPDERQGQVPAGAMLMFVEDVGRHNAIDTITGWMALHDIRGADKVFYTTGRLTSEMVMKAAQIGVPIIVSRNGVTAMGHEMAQKLGMTLFGRAANRHFLCYTGFERFDAEPEPQRPAVRVVVG
jgi:FdhD protein